MNQRRQARVEWLAAHKSLWEDWLERNDPRARSVVEAMRRDGVIAQTTYWPDVQLTNLINDARNMLRKKGRTCRKVTATEARG
jgi:hypothetical protein